MADTTSLPTNWEVNALFSVFIFNQISGNYLSSTGRTLCFQATKSEWGISKFISRKVLSDPSNGYIIDDSCVFVAEVFVVKREAAIERVLLTNVNTYYNHALEISGFSQLPQRWVSEEFDAGGQKWKILLYPKGNAEGTGMTNQFDDKKTRRYFFSY
ncbi:PREDICTED: ubiquitin carboxyl-terminal hydrolase 12-like [Erythranthe guttata]|uniref:ubiquitin carboxyl-terminal hydrolase 12-like n=1 Tax=Erythranthe guttata TaxID=4155 RepID=UPI00064DE9D2|nr:PREDICTED: ubiquitin carboxyl-terminal hydrolase 12-like [Erythranthe guttata]|eukprot:XP_012851646.1 PREDICTED: ubiquitin carboxyl-terminal hydrolase 12-like [Erythranthe guttata]